MASISDHYIYKRYITYLTFEDPLNDNTLAVNACGTRQSVPQAYSYGICI